MRIAYNLACVLLAVFIGISASAAGAADAAFSDSFESLDKWTKVGGADAKLGMLRSGELRLPCMLLANGVAKAELPVALEDSFELSFRASHNAYRRGLWVGLLNDEGSQGYAVAWDSCEQSTFHDQGSIAIAKFDLPREVAWADQFGTVLTKRVQSGQKVVGGWPPLIVLKWSKASGLLTLSVEGQEVGRIIDRSFTRFSRVYVRGNEQSIIAEMSVRSASPATRPSRP